MLKLLRPLLATAALVQFAAVAPAQTGPQLTVGPGLIYTIASGATNGLSPTVGFNVAVFRSQGGQSFVYVADAHSEQVNQSTSISLANVYAINLATGQVTRVAGAAPDHTNGNAAACAAGTPAVCPGDGGPATSARLQEPSGLAFDSAGNLFIADERQNVIRRVDAGTGNISTVAGVGTAGVGCNACAATQANFSFPTGLAFDGNNNLYVVDTGNHRVRQIAAANGTITTVAGTGASGFNGDGPATSAQLNTPLGVTVDASGNIFIADTANHAIREVAGGNLTTVAGQGGTAGYSGDGGAATNATLYSPRGVAVDLAGDLYITSGNPASPVVNVIRKVTGDVSHTISTIAGTTAAGYSGDGGPAQSALLSGPTFISVDAQNNLYFVDQSFTVIRRILSSPAPLTLPLTAVGSTGASPYSVTISNTGNQTLTISSVNFPANFTAALGGTCQSGSFNLNAGASCTIPVNFTPTSGGSTSGTLAISSNGGNQNVYLSETNGLYFVPVIPCRVIDTRSTDASFGGPVFAAGEDRAYAIRNSNGLGCAANTIPAGVDVQAYSLNVTVVPRGALNFLTVYPGGTRPVVSTLNSYDARIKANAAIVPANTSDANRGIRIYASDATDVIVDINGYYVPEITPASATNNQAPLAFYPLPPCRAVDTRPGSGLATQNSLILASQAVNYTLTGACGLPSTAQAFALNFTALPSNGSSLGFLTTWAAGATRPVVSTLNAPTGTTTANAAIVPASTNGSISVYSTSDTNLIIDVAGYYAPPAAGGLALYNVTPCRAFDSRASGSSPLTSGVSASLNIASGGSCSIPPAAQSYVLNATALPSGALGFLTAWPTGSAQPVQSVLNANDAAVTSNLAVVPTVNGSISAYASSSSGLILDLSAYFAP